MFTPPGISEEWRGHFTGQTKKGERYEGTYEVRATEDATWSIDGVRLRVLGYHIDVRFDGDITGTVSVSYWIAPRYGLTVREEYYADAKVGPLDYFGEWSVELRSLQPRT